MVVAALAANSINGISDLNFRSRVATKYPKVAVDFFNGQGIQAEVIKMNGNIELAPMVGMADVIVDITETGTTLKENGLIEIARVFDITSRLIANRVSYKVGFTRIQSIVQALENEICGIEVRL
jgi:ATP phosphoribosyltransferase